MISEIINTNFQEIWIVILRSFFSFMLLFCITKMIGKKQVSELSLFDYVVSISIGNFAAEISMNLDEPFLNGIVGLFVFGLIAYLVTILSMKSITLRRFFMGVPTIIMEDGKFIYDNFKKIKIDINNFLEAARANGYFDVSEIKYALMEADGKISFMPKDEYKTITLKDMNLKTQNKGLVANVILDEKIITKNLLNINKDEIWLRRMLKCQGYNDSRGILLATVDINNKITIYKKYENTNIKNMLE